MLSGRVFCEGSRNRSYNLRENPFLFRAKLSGMGTSVVEALFRIAQRLRLVLATSMLSLLKIPSGHEIGLPTKAMADDFRLFEWSAALSGPSLPAWVLSAPVFERRNCGRRRRPAVPTDNLIRAGLSSEIG